MRRRIIFLLSLLLTLTVLTAIYCFSAQPAAQSSGISNALTILVARMMPWMKRKLTMHGLHHLLRKLAHFTLYFLLGCGLTGMLHNGVKPLPEIFAILLGALCAVLDEMHQAFVPGRGPRLQDVALDTLGVATAMALLLLIFRLRRRRDGNGENTAKSD